MSEDPIQYGKKIMPTEFNIQKRAMLEALEKSLGIVTTAAKQRNGQRLSEDEIEKYIENTKTGE